MTEARAVINVDINTAGAAAGIRRLQSQLNAFQSTLLSSNRVQAQGAKNLSLQLKELVNATQFFSAETVRMRTSAGRLDDTLSKGKGSIAQYFNSFKRGSTEASQVMSLAHARAAALQTQFIATGAAAGGYREAMAIRPLTAFNGAAAVSAQRLAIQRAMLTQATTHMINFGKNTQWAGRQLMVGFTVPLTIFGAVAGKTFMEIEKQAISFKKVYGDSFTTPKELEENLKAVQGLSEEYTKYGIAASKTMELAAQAAAMGAQGATLTDAITESTKLATLGQMEQTKALETTIALQNAFGLSGEKLAKSVNFLNMVENQTVVTLQDLAEAIPRVAPVIKGLGGSVEDMAAMIAAMKEGGVSAAQGANALKSGLGSLINPSKRASEQLKAVGINMNQIISSNRGDLMGIVQDFGKALSTIDEFGQQQVLEKVFGKYQYARLGALFNNIVKDGTQASKVLKMTTLSAAELQRTADKELGVIADSPATKMTAAIEKLKLAIVPIGEMFVKFATPVVELFTRILKIFDGLPEGVKKFGAIGAIIVGVIIPAGTMFLGLLLNLIGTLVKFGHIIGVAFKGLLSGGIGGAVKAVSQSLKYMSLSEIDAANASKQLGESTIFVNSALNAQVGELAGVNAAIVRLTESYALLRTQMNLTAASNPMAFSRGEAAAVIAAGGTPAAPPRRVRRNAGGTIPYYSTGNTVPGSGNTDTVPAMLTPGEFVINKKATADNLSLLHAINNGNTPLGFNKGGSIPGVQNYGVGNFVRSIFKPKPKPPKPLSAYDTEPTEKETARELSLWDQRPQNPGVSQFKRTAASSESQKIYEELTSNSPLGQNIKVDTLRFAVERLGFNPAQLGLRGHGNFIVGLSQRANLAMAGNPPSLTRNGLLSELTYGNPPVMKKGVYEPIDEQINRYFGDGQPFDYDAFDNIFRNQIEIAKEPISNKLFEKISRNALRLYLEKNNKSGAQSRSFIKDILTKDTVRANVPRSDIEQALMANGIAYETNGKDIIATVDGVRHNFGSLAGREMGSLGRPDGIIPYANIAMASGLQRAHANKGGMIPGMQYFAANMKTRVVQKPKQKLAHASVAKEATPQEARKLLREAEKSVYNPNTDTVLMLDGQKLKIDSTYNEQMKLVNSGASADALAAHIANPRSTPHLFEALKFNEIAFSEKEAEIFRNHIAREIEKIGEPVNDSLFAKAYAEAIISTRRELEKNNLSVKNFNAVIKESKKIRETRMSWEMERGTELPTLNGVEQARKEMAKQVGAGSLKEGDLFYYRDSGSRKNTVLSKEGVGVQSGSTRRIAKKAKGGMIPGVPGLSKGALFLGMPHGFSTRDAGLRGILSRSTMEATTGRFATMPVSDVGTITQRSSGKSSTIPGLDGIYEMNGQRSVIKVHETAESALAESRSANLMNSVFGLTSPRQEVIKMRHPETGDMVFAVRSPFDPTIASSTGGFEKENFAQQLIASVIRRDSDLQPDNVFGSVVADNGASIFGMNEQGRPRASQPRIIGDNPISAIEQLDINLLKKAGGAKKFFAESSADIAREMSADEYQDLVKRTISNARARTQTAVDDLPNLTETERTKYLSTILNDLDQLDAIDWKAVHGHHIGLFPAKKKTPTAAAIKKAEEAAAKKKADEALRIRQRGHNQSRPYGLNFLNSGGMASGIQYLMAGARVGGGGRVSANVVKWLKDMMLGGRVQREILLNQVPVNIDEALSTATRRMSISRGSIDPITSPGNLRDFSHWSTYGGVGRFMDDSELGTRMRAARWRKSVHEFDIEKDRKKLDFIKRTPAFEHPGQVESLERSIRWAGEGIIKQQAIIDDLMAEFVPTAYRTSIKKDQRYFDVSGTVPRDEQVLSTPGASKEPLNEMEVAMMGATMSGQPTIRNIGEAEARARFHAAQERIKDINRSISSGRVNRDSVNGLLRNLSEEAENMAAFANWGRGREVIYPGIVGRYNIGGNVFESGPSNKIVPGVGNTDTVPAVLTPGEFVVNKKATKNNLNLLHKINNGNVRGYAAGDIVERDPDNYFVENHKGQEFGPFRSEKEAKQILKNMGIVKTNTIRRPRPSRPKNPGRAMGIGMGLGSIGGAMMMAPMISGVGSNEGLTNALTIGGSALSAASIIPSLAPMLGPLAAIAAPAAIVVGALAAAGTALYLWRKNVDESARASAELGANLGTTSNALNTMAKLLGLQTPSQRSMQLQMGVSTKEAEMLNSPEMQSILSSEDGQKFITDLKDVTSAERFKKLSDYLKSAIASGMMDKNQATAFAKAVGMQLGDVVLGTSVSSAVRNQKTGSGALLELANQRKSAQEQLGEAPGADQSSKIIGGALQVIQDFSNAEALAREEFSAGTISFEEMKRVIDDSREAQKAYTDSIEESMKKTSDFGGTMQATKDQMIKSGFINEDQSNAITAAATSVASVVTPTAFGRGSNVPVLNKDLEATMLSSIAAGMNPDTAIRIGEEISKGSGLMFDAYQSGIKDKLDPSLAFEKAGAADQLRGIIKGNFKDMGMANGLLDSFTRDGGKPTELLSYLGGISEGNRNKTVSFMTGLSQKDQMTMISDSQNLSQSIDQPLVEKLQMSDAYEKALDSGNTEGINKAISKASEAGISERVLTYAINTYANGEKADPIELEKKINQLTIASESIASLPDEMIKGLGIDINDPKDLEKFGPMVKQLEDNWKIIQNLNPNIDLVASMEYLTMENGKPISMTESSKRVQKLNKAFKNLGSGKDSIRKQAQIDIATAYAGSSAEPEVAAANAIDELKKQFKNFDDFDPIIQEQMIKIRIGYEVENLQLVTQLNNAMAALQGATDAGDRHTIIQRIAQLQSQIGANNQNAKAELGSTDTGGGGGGSGGGGGGTKSITEQLKEEFENLKKIYDSMGQFINSKKGKFKGIISGPFGPEFIEYLKSQGEEGIKVLKGGLNKIKAAYEEFKKVQKQNAINFAQSLPANLLREKQNFKIQNIFEQRLEKAGFNEEQSQLFIEGIGGTEGIRDYLKANKKKPKDRTKEEQRLVSTVNKAIKQGGQAAKELDQDKINDEATKSIQEMNKEIDIKNKLLTEGYTQEEADQIMQLGDVSKLSADQIEKLGASIKQYNLAVLASNPEALSQAVRDNLININNIKREIDQINIIGPLEKELKILEKSNETKSRAIELKQRELEPLDEQINKIQELSEKTSEAYDNQIKALDKIYEREDKIASLKQAQLGVAQALSRGDVGAAAQGALQMSQDIAQQSREEARSALEAQKEAAAKNNQDQILAIQQQRKVIENQIKNLQAEQRIIQDSIYIKQGEINIEADRLDGLYNNAANELKNLHDQLTKAIILQKSLSDAAAPAPVASDPAAAAPVAFDAAGSYASNQAALDTLDLLPDGYFSGQVPLPTMTDAPQKPSKPNRPKPGKGSKKNLGGIISSLGSTEPPPTMMNYGGMMKKYAYGSMVPGMGMTDKVPALLTPGEFVIRKPVAETYGPMLSALNSQVFPKMNLSSSMPSLESNENEGNVYNYQVSVALNGSNLDPNDVANVVMQKIKMSESRNLRSNNIRG